MPAGRSADGTYGAGARRTFPRASREEAWGAWAGREGLARWLGRPARAALEEGGETALADGTRVRAVRVRPPAQLRLRLARAGWPRPRTAQLRVLAAARGVTVALHIEGLPDAASRAACLEDWARALDRFGQGRGEGKSEGAGAASRTARAAATDRTKRGTAPKRPRARAAGAAALKARSR